MRVLLACLIGLAACNAEGKKDGAVDRTATRPDGSATDTARDAGLDAALAADSIAKPDTALAPCATRITYGSTWIKAANHPESYDDLKGLVTWDGACKVDAAGNAYVASSLSSNVFRIAPSGTVTKLVDSTGGGVASLYGAFGLAVDKKGVVYVTGAASDNVLRIAPNGTVTELMDAAGDGVRALDFPTRVAVDGAGAVFVVGQGSNNAFRIEPRAD